jgi:hypothetical protein
MTYSPEWRNNHGFPPTDLAKSCLLGHIGASRLFLAADGNRLATCAFRSHSPRCNFAAIVLSDAVIIKKE